MSSNSNAISFEPPRRLRIAHVILSRGFAGSERSTAESCNAQCEGHEVLLVLRQDHRGASGASIRDPLDPRVAVAEVPARLFTRRRLARVLAEWRPDVVHAHLRRATRLVAQADPQAAKISTLHLSVNGPHFLHMDGLVCISPWQVQSIPAAYRGRVFSIPNSLVPHPRLPAERVAELREELGAGADTFLVGGVGRLAQSKGFDILIAAFKQANLPNARLALVGDGRERSRLEKMAGPGVCFAGFRRNVKDYYQAFDVFVCPSRREPMGRVILEALDAGMPVIAADVSGPREILAQYPGELVPAENVAELAAALTRQHARARARLDIDLSAHHLDQVASKLIAAYRQVIADRAAPRFLFVPASGPAGSGEYMRCVMLAGAIRHRWPDAQIHFAINGKASYAHKVPYPALLLDSSPAHASAAVNEHMRSVKPDVVIFDNTGRAGQLAAAKAAGAACVFVSSRPNARRKGLRLSRVRWLDQHWVAQPQWATPPATWWERLKKQGRPRLETLHLDAVFEASEPERRRALRRELGVEEQAYLAFCAGGGGNFGNGPRAADVMLEAAGAIAASTGRTCVVVLGPNYERRAAQPPNVVAVDQLDNARLMDLLHDAEIVVTSGGDVLMQALVQGKPCVAVPVAGDQPARIRRCAERGLIQPAALDSKEVAREVAALLADPPRREAMTAKQRDMGMRNGLLTAVEALERLLAR